MTVEDFRNLIDYLESPEACNFQIIGVDKTDWSWNCDGTLDLTHGWLDDHFFQYDEISELLDEYGATCDCEVVLNVGRLEGVDGQTLISMLL